MTEFVPRPSCGRRFSAERRVRLSEAGTDGLLRLDGMARYLQDVATDDWTDSGLDPEDTWVVRRTAVAVSDGGRWPQLGEKVRLTTWCSGVGGAWAERRTDFELDSVVTVRAVALWVSLDRAGRPLRLGRQFHDVYGEAMAGRRVSGRVPVPAPPASGDALASSWSIRRADLDVIGHVNNAAVWAALAEVTSDPVASASLTHHAPVERDDEVTLLTEPGRVWLLADGKLKVSAEYSYASD